MKRDKQIELLKCAERRIQERAAAWLDDSGVRAFIRSYHEQTRQMKAPPPARACG